MDGAMFTFAAFRDAAVDPGGVIADLAPPSAITNASSVDWSRAICGRISFFDPTDVTLDKVQNVHLCVETIGNNVCHKELHFHIENGLSQPLFPGQSSLDESGNLNFTLQQKLDLTGDGDITGKRITITAPSADGTRTIISQGTLKPWYALLLSPPLTPGIQLGPLHFQDASASIPSHGDQDQAAPEAVAAPASPSASISPLASAEAFTSPVRGDASRPSSGNGHVAATAAASSSSACLCSTCTSFIASGSAGSSSESKPFSEAHQHPPTISAATLQALHDAHLPRKNKRAKIQAPSAVPSTPAEAQAMHDSESLRKVNALMRRRYGREMMAAATAASASNGFQQQSAAQHVQPSSMQYQSMASQNMNHCCVGSNGTPRYDIASQNIAPLYNASQNIVPQNNAQDMISQNMFFQDTLFQGTASHNVISQSMSLPNVVFQNVNTQSQVLQYLAPQTASFPEGMVSQNTMPSTGMDVSDVSNFSGQDHAVGSQAATSNPNLWTGHSIGASIQRENPQFTFSSALLSEELEMPRASSTENPNASAQGYRFSDFIDLTEEEEKEAENPIGSITVDATAAHQQVSPVLHTQPVSGIKNPAVDPFLSSAQKVSLSMTDFENSLENAPAASQTMVTPDSLDPAQPVWEDIWLAAYLDDGVEPTAPEPEPELEVVASGSNAITSPLEEEETKTQEQINAEAYKKLFPLLQYTSSSASSVESSSPLSEKCDTRL